MSCAARIEKGKISMAAGTLLLMVCGRKLYAKNRNAFIEFTKQFIKKTYQIENLSMVLTIRYKRDTIKKHKKLLKKVKYKTEIDMNQYNQLSPLPLGSIQPRGWMLEQLKRNKEGIGGNLPRLEPRMIATPYTTRETEPRWGKERKAGWGAEISGNYWNGLIELAFTLDDPDLKKMADDWVNAVLANRQEDGYLGTYTAEDNLFDDYNAWGTACGMNALLSYYSATGRKDVLEAVHGCMLWFCKNWAGDQKSRYGGVSIVGPMSEVYLRTGDERLLQFCEDYYVFLERNDLFDKSLSACLAPQLHYNANHGAGYAENISHPLEVYLMNGDKRYLEATLNAYRKARDKVIQKTGGITCENEYLAPLGAAVETEYCATAMLNLSLAKMLYTTADPEYADMMERTVFNAGEGARKKDERAIAYFHSPNQVFATEFSSHTWQYHQVYAPCVPTSCCPVLSVRMLPEFMRYSVLKGEKNSLWFSAYAPMHVSDGELSFETETRYPFRDTIEYRVGAKEPAERTLYFRIPDWCDGASIRVNGAESVAVCKAKSYACISGTWKDGDVITLTFPMKVMVSQVNDSDRSGKLPITIEYGPLLYALAIPEQWEAYPGSPYTPLPEDWKWYRVLPVIPPSGLDVYDEMGKRKYLISWNAALEEGITPDQIKVEMLENEGYPWENPLVKLHVPAWKAPYSYPPYPGRTFEPYGDHGKVAVTERMDIELVPFGCTALRISYFPRADR